MEEAKNNQSLKDQKLPDSKEVVVSEIAHGGKLSIQIVSPGKNLVLFSVS